MNKPINYDRQIAILDFWHKTEFFLPFNLKHELNTKSKPEKLRTFSKRELWDVINAEELWSYSVPIDEEITGFNLYLAMFDHKDLVLATHTELEKLGLLAEDEFFEEKIAKNFMKEGETCFAKIRISAEGYLIPTGVEVSAAPWAMGKIIKDGFNSLDFSIFDQDLKNLKNELSTAYAKYIKSDIEENESYVEKPLTGKEICKIIKLLLDWANYNPGYQDDTPTAIIQVLTQKISKKEKNENNKSVNQKPLEFDINILNSFYAKDIAKVIQSLNKGLNSKVLSQYLNAKSIKPQLNLYTPKGLQEVYHNLLPKYLNLGHWFSEPAHKMSLMQQFAINTLFKEGEVQPLFSVNGPPGTGKTTLLRDIFAENIVQRAQKLSQYAEATEAFLPQKQQVNFYADNSYFISVLKPELTGFEMVVASSNNSAVENISKELPQIASLGDYWLNENKHPKVQYLKNIMLNMVSQTDKSYNLALNNESPWGLFSVALGKKANRKDFVSKFYFVSKDKHNFDPNIHQSIWSWRNQQQENLNYKEIREKFIQAKQELENEIRLLTIYIEQNKFFHTNTFSSYYKNENQQLALLEKEQQENQEDLARHQQTYKENELYLDNAKQQGIWLDKNKPSFLTRLCNRQERELFNQNKRENAEAIQKLFKQKDTLLTFIHHAEQKAEKLKDDYQQQILKIKKCQQEWENKVNAFEYLRKKFSDISFPENMQDIEAEKWQIDGLWFSEELNCKRSELFHLALQLHEAWLAEVSQPDKGFGANLIAIEKILEGKKLLNPQHALAIWQSLFMVVPVISTTFSSFAAQFCDLGQESLGWLFIDEAGQASPQMAVGALWRAKRAVVVGDPLQIEPVITTNENLIEALKKTSKLPSELDYSPNKVSVQNLADLANSFGIELQVGDQSQWLGSPLRVHRRCVEPMFSIANHIAYQNNMIYFDPFNPEKRNPPAQSINIGHSAWVNIVGEAKNKHIGYSRQKCWCFFIKCL